MKKRKIITIVSILVIIAAAFLVMMFLASLKKEPPKTPPREVKRYVKVSKVTYGDVESQVVGEGRLVSSRQVDVIAEVQGKILRGDVPLKKGQSFKKGDLLFRIYDREARLGLAARKSRFLNAIANLLPDFKVDYPDSYPKWRRFLASIDIEKNLPPLPAITSDQEKIFLAGRNTLSDFYSIKSEEVRLKKYSIIAPFTGAYTSVLLEAGSVANPGGRVGKIIRTDQLELEVPIKANDADWIKQGDTVYVGTEDGSKKWTGTVVRKAQFIDASSQRIGVFVGLESKGDNPLVPGLYLRAVFPGVMVRNAMQIPRNAVFNSNEVFVVNGGRLAKREINIHKVDQKELIFSGLEEGTDLVVEPLVNAAENAKVEIFTNVTNGADKIAKTDKTKPGQTNPLGAVKK
ncbi:MAG: efflux RND transporter periplasmic adaptor subunit [bacterium]|nr:efflux RND transporter periplasmic adaptor subunit [bacterium]